MRFGDKLKVVSAPNQDVSYEGAILTVVDNRPSYDVRGERLHCSVVYANGKEAGPYHSWSNYGLEVIALATIGTTPFRAGDKLVYRADAPQYPGAGRITGAVAVALSREDYGASCASSSVPYEISGYSRSHCPADLWDLLNAKTADEGDYGKGVHVLCTSTAGNPEDGNGVEEGVYYVVKSYEANADDRLSGIVRLRGVEGRYSTQRFRKASADEVKGLVPDFDSLASSDLFGADFASIEARLYEAIFGRPREVTMNTADGPRTRLFSPAFGLPFGRSPRFFDYEFPSDIIVNVGGDLSKSRAEEIAEMMRTVIPRGTVSGRFVHRPGEANANGAPRSKVPPFDLETLGDRTTVNVATGITGNGPGATATGESNVNAARGLRFNSGKRRMDLVPPDALAVLADVYTRGAEKYAERNWEKGMPFSEVLASLERHTLAFKAGEDHDPESKQLHAAHMAWNAMTLLTYQLRGIGEDDRYKVNLPKIGDHDLKDPVAEAKDRVFEKSPLAADHLAVELSEALYVIGWNGPKPFFGPGKDGLPCGLVTAVATKEEAGKGTLAQVSKIIGRYQGGTIGAHILPA